MGEKEGLVWDDTVFPLGEAEESVATLKEISEVGMAVRVVFEPLFDQLSEATEIGFHSLISGFTSPEWRRLQRVLKKLAYWHLTRRAILGRQVEVIEGCLREEKEIINEPLLNVCEGL